MKVKKARSRVSTGSDTLKETIQGSDFDPTDPTSSKESHKTPTLPKLKDCPLLHNGTPKLLMTFEIVNDRHMTVHTLMSLGRACFITASGTHAQASTPHTQKSNETRVQTATMSPFTAVIIVLTQF